MLEGSLKSYEILSCLKKSSNNTSPGSDGLTYEFFKFFWKDVGEFLVRAVNSCFYKGELSDSLKRGIITCIPKGNKDKLLLKNWRPISLLNTSYKLASAAIAERLKLVLSSIINEDQTGFISERYIGENIRILYDVLQYTEEHNLPGMLLLIDFEKAFDSVSWDFLFKVLQFYNFGESFIKWVKLFYNKCQSCVIVNGHLSEWFYLQRGCRQGDPLSPYLFVICADILATLIRRHQGIKGITIGGIEFLVSQYADDTSLILDGSRESLVNCLQILKLYANASGLCVNIDKTKVVWIGNRKSSNIRFCEEFNLQRETEFNVLGVKFTNNLKEMVDLNYAEKLVEIKKLFLNWSKRILTPLGKITVIKSLALSKINHLILSLPNPSKQIIDELQKMFYQYLWDKKPDKIKRNVITQNYADGGLRMTEIGTFIKALKLTWLRRILLNINKYSEFLNTEYLFIYECLQYGGKYFNVNNVNIKNEFWKDVILSLNTFIENVKPDSWKELLTIPLWYNHSIKVGGNVIFYRSWKNKGIITINDLLDPNGEILSYADFQRKYQLPTNFLVYEGIVRSIKDYIFSFNFAPFIYRQDNPILPYPLLHILKHKKGCRNIYDKFNIKDTQPKSVMKWRIELDNEEHFQWKKVFNLPFKVTKDVSLRWLQVRINHRILGLKHYLHKLNLAESDKCTFCNQTSETIKHIFWECEHTEYFWDGFKLMLQDNCELVVNFDAENIIFGDPNFDNLLNELILIGKRYLFRMKIEKKMPSLNMFLKLVKLNYKIQRYNAVKHQNLSVLEKKWDKYRGLLIMVP